MSANIDEQSDPSFNYVAPPRTWRGRELSPYSLGTKMLIGMIVRQEDTMVFFLFCVLYVLIHDRKEVQRDTRDKEALREKILSWLDSLNLKSPRGIPPKEGEQPDPNYYQGEEADTLDMVTAILKEANTDKVDVIATGAAGNV